MKQKVKTPEDIKQELIEREIAKIAPRMSFLAFVARMRPDYEFGWFNKQICEVLQDFYESYEREEAPRVMLNAPPRSGKLCADDTPVLTTKGWKTHGELRIGDFVFHPNGNPVKVVAVGEKNYATHCVEFTNGEKICVHLDHEWTFEHNGTLETIETRDIRSDKEYKLPFIDVCVVSVEKLPEPKLGNCIQVDSPDGLYLVGKKLIPTHNSELSSRLFPAWILGKNPDANIVLCSYSGELATTFAKDVMRIMESDTYKEIFPDSRLQGSKRSEDGVNYARQTNFFEVVKKKGSFYAVGTGGSLTGRNCSILILDDLVKDSASADSQTIRDNTWEWLTTTAWTRLFKKNGVLCLMTRWHLDDVASRLLASQDPKQPWVHVNFKAIADEDEKYRKAGEALHPARFPLSTLQKIKKQIGERAWLSLYQQSPVPDGGALFKSNWICYYADAERPFEFEKEIVSLDCSFDGKAVNDYSVMTHWGVKKGRYYLLDCLRGHWDYVGLRKRFKEFCQQFPKAVTKLIEKKANGDAIIADLRNEGVIGLTPIIPKDSKVSRANSVTPLFESSSVFFPDRRTHSWVDECVIELCSFPQAKHDDFVDSCTQALNYFMSKHSRAIDPSVKRMLTRPR